VAGDAFAAILGKKEQLKKAMEETNVGTKAKKVVEMKREEATPNAKDPDAPSKFNTPRKPGEDLGTYADRIKALQAAHKSGE
jgi:hypothetical protein